MKDAEIIAIKNYQENIAFLKTKHHSVFQKIEALESAIDNHYYKERYELQYKENYFDVLELSSGNYLYGVDSWQYAKDVSSKINYSKSINCYSTFQRVEITDEEAIEFEKEAVCDDDLSSISKLLNFYTNHITDETTMKKIYKFIFLGVGLGTHITTLDEKLHSNIYFIIEDDLELFRLSLFVTNYFEIDKHSEIIFSIFDEEDEFIKNTNLFLEKQYFYNQYIQYFNMLSHSSTKLKTIHRVIAMQEHLTFTFSGLLNHTLKPIYYLNNNYKFLNLNCIKDDFLEDKPVLLLGAGSSFLKNIQWIKENQNSFIIVAISAVLAELESYNIKVDIITHTHGLEDAMGHIQKIKDKDFFKDSIIIAGTSSYLGVLQFFNKENIFMHETNTTFKENFLTFTNGNIGADSFEFFMHFKAKDIYLLGLDFALDQESGSSHFANHEYAYRSKLKESELSQNIAYKKDIIKVKGNFRDEVFTTLLLYNGLQSFTNIYNYTDYRPKNLYNLSDGAYLLDAKSKHTQSIKDLTPIDKTSLKLKEKLNLCSETELRKTEKETLSSLRKSALLKIKLLDEQLPIDILFKHLTIPYTNNNDELNEILKLYTHHISGYIFDILNTQELHITEEALKELFIPQLKRLLLYFYQQLAIP